MSLHEALSPAIFKIRTTRIFARFHFCQRHILIPNIPLESPTEEDHGLWLI